jgi:hypothetical protein
MNKKQIFSYAMICITMHIIAQEQPLNDAVAQKKVAIRAQVKAATTPTMTIDDQMILVDKMIKEVDGQLGALICASVFDLTCMDKKADLQTRRDVLWEQFQELVDKKRAASLKK